MRILLAEDNPVNQKVAFRMLERMGYAADIANNGLEALNILKEKKYDIILMDMQMPEMDGLEATRKIVERYSPEERPYIIALTANAMHGDRERCINAGMNDYISKPIRLEDLREAFDRCPVKETAPDEEDGEEVAVEGNAIDYSVLEQLIEMLGDDTEFAYGLIGDFLTDGQELVDLAITSCKTSDASELERATHTLKSSSATFGAMKTSALCKELEELGNRGDLGPDTLSKTEQLAELFASARLELEKFLSKQVA